MNSTEFVGRYRQSVSTFCEALDLVNAKVKQYQTDPTLFDAHCAAYPPDPMDGVIKQDLIDAITVLNDLNQWLGNQSRLAKLMKLR